MINPILPSYSRANLRFTEGHGSWLISDKGKKLLGDKINIKEITNSVKN